MLKRGTVWGGVLVGIVRYPARGNSGRLQGTLATARCCPSWPFTNAHGPTPPTAAILSAGLLLREVVRLADSMQFRPRTCQLVCLPRRRSVGEGVPRGWVIRFYRPGIRQMGIVVGMGVVMLVGLVIELVMVFGLAFEIGLGVILGIELALEVGSEVGSAVGSAVGSGLFCGLGLGLGERIGKPTHALHRPLPAI